MDTEKNVWQKGVDKNASIIIHIKYVKGRLTLFSLFEHFHFWGSAWHMSPDTWEGVCFTEQPVFCFLWCQPQNTTVHTPTDHVAHIQAELGWLIWARMQMEFSNFHNKIKPCFHAHLALQTTRKHPAHSERREATG